MPGARQLLAQVSGGSACLSTCPPTAEEELIRLNALVMVVLDLVPVVKSGASTKYI